MKATRYWWDWEDQRRHQLGQRYQKKRSPEQGSLVYDLQRYLQGYAGIHRRKADIARDFGCPPNSIESALAKLTELDEKLSEDPDSGQILYKEEL